MEGNIKEFSTLRPRSVDSFDVVRVTAMFGVVADHFLQMTGQETFINVGKFLGGVGVAMFFSLSAYLFGNKWRNQEFKAFKPLPFLRKRFVKIFIPLWIALFFIIALEIYSQHSIDIKTITFNYLGLAWAKPFMWAGHLWYITMILILYIVFLILSKIRMDKIPLQLWFIFIGGAIAVVIFLPFFQYSLSKALIPFTILFASMLFASGDKIMSFCNCHKILICLIALLMFFGTLYLYKDGALDSYKGIATVLNSITGLMLFISIASICKIHKQSIIIKYLSDISYEVYLIHLTAIMLVRVLWSTFNSHTLIEEGMDSFSGYNPFLFYTCSIIAILVSSSLLNIVCKKINNVILRKI